MCSFAALSMEPFSKSKEYFWRHLSTGTSTVCMSKLDFFLYILTFVKLLFIPSFQAVCPWYRCFSYLIHPTWPLIRCCSEIFENVTFRLVPFYCVRSQMRRFFWRELLWSLMFLKKRKGWAILPLFERCPRHSNIGFYSTQLPSLFSLWLMFANFFVGSYDRLYWLHKWSV